MSEAEQNIPLLAPLPAGKTLSNMRSKLALIAKRVAKKALEDRPNCDILLEVYAAGVTHGQAVAMSSVLEALVEGEGLEIEQPRTGAVPERPEDLEVAQALAFEMYYVDPIHETPEAAWPTHTTAVQKSALKAVSLMRQQIATMTSKHDEENQSLLAENERLTHDQRTAQTRLGEYAQNEIKLRRELELANQRVENLKKEALLDDDRFNFLRAEIHNSPSGISFDLSGNGYRFMRRWQVGSPQDTVREAIDAAMKIKKSGA